MAIVVSSRFLALTFCVAIGLFMLSNSHGVSAQITKCGGTPISDLMGQCGQYVQPGGPQTDPSPSCCAAVKGADIPCLCKYVTPGIEKIVSMEKVVYVGRKCGVNVPGGMQCGSYKVPPSVAA